MCKFKLICRLKTASMFQETTYTDTSMYGVLRGSLKLVTGQRLTIVVT